MAKKRPGRERPSARLPELDPQHQPAHRLFAEFDRLHADRVRVPQAAAYFDAWDRAEPLSDALTLFADPAELAKAERAERYALRCEKTSHLFSLNAMPDDASVERAQEYAAQWLADRRDKVIQQLSDGELVAAGYRAPRDGDSRLHVIEASWWRRLQSDFGRSTACDPATAVAFVEIVVLRRGDLSATSSPAKAAQWFQDRVAQLRQSGEPIVMAELRREAKTAIGLSWRVFEALWKKHADYELRRPGRRAASSPAAPVSTSPKPQR